MTSVARALERWRRDERGLTVVEGVIAALLLVVGALATLAVLDAAARNTYRAEESQVLINRLQAELERIRQLPYDSIAMSEPPPPAADPDDRNDPLWRVSGTDYAISSSGANPRPMVIVPPDPTVPGSGGQVEPGPTPFQTEGVSGEIYRFVVWIDDPQCPDCGAEVVKRVIVAVKLDEAPISFERRFQEVQTDVVDPDASADNNPAPPGGGGTSTASLWLTDTACNASAPEAPATADHLTHNTRGVCSDGPQVGPIPGAPDLLASEPPPPFDDPGTPGADPQPLVDYAQDVEPEILIEPDKGLQIRKPAESGCLLDGDPLDLPAADLTGHEKMHKWLSPPVPAGDDLLLRGTATLELLTQTINDASHPGALCVWLFVREQAVGGGRVDTPMIDVTSATQETYFRFQRDPWPRPSVDGWGKIGIQMRFPPVSVQPGEQIGIAIQLESSGLGTGNALQFMYNHIDLQSRLELETDRTLPF